MRETPINFKVGLNRYSSLIFSITFNMIFKNYKLNWLEIVRILFSVLEQIVVGQLAWLICKQVSVVPDLPENRSLLISHQRLNVEQPTDDVFEQWLVGFTDGDGSFSITRQGRKAGLYFKLSQSSYNLRVLHYIKKRLGRGSIFRDKHGNCEFRIRDINTIREVIIPIFNRYPLITSKHFNFLLFSRACDIILDSSLSIVQRNSALDDLKKQTLPNGYVSPYVQNMTKSWLVGFTEAEGSFYLISKSNTLVHVFEIVQKLDKVVLEKIASMLGLTKVTTKKAGYHTVVTTNSRAIENIIKYYTNSMKGMKQVEFRIWTRSYNKHKGNYKALSKIQDGVRVMRRNNIDKTFN